MSSKYIDAIIERELKNSAMPHDPTADMPLEDFLKMCAKKARTTYLGEDLILYKGDELPMQAFLGTVWMKSGNGSVIQFESRWEHDYKPDTYIYVQKGYDVQKIVDVTFHVLARKDKAIFRKWENFNMYDMEDFHRLLDILKQNGFQIYVKK